MNQQDKDRLRELAQSSLWTGKWYDAGCETVMGINGKDDYEVAHPEPIGIAAFIAAANPQAILSLLEENEALAKKAKRYDWLRDVAHPDYEASGISVSEVDFNDWGNRFTRYFHGSELDAAIDAAMQPKGE